MNIKDLRKDEKGFTLAELLIVVAIIAVLVAIAIPVFTAQLEKSREATDAANIRAKYAELMVKAIDDPSNTSITDTVTLVQQDTDWQNTDLKNSLTKVFDGDTDAATELAKVGKGQKATLSWVAATGTGSSTVEGHLTIKVEAAGA